MIKVITTLLLVSLNFASHAQINADSLWGIWNDKAQPDTTRLKAIDDLTFKYFFQSLYQLDSTSYYGQKMLDLAKEKGLKKYQANALHNMALPLTHTGRMDEGLDLNSQSLAIREEIGDTKGVGRSLANIGLIYRIKKNYVLALDHYKRALVNFEDVEDLGLIGHAMTQMGSIYGEIGDMPSSIKYLANCLSITEKSGNMVFLTQSLLNLAAACQQVNEIDKSKEYLIRAYEIAKSAELKESEMFALHSLGILSISEGEYHEALAYSDTILSRSNKNESVGFNQHLNLAYDLKGRTYLGMDDYDNALKYFDLSNNLYKQIGGRSNSLSIALQLGTVYRLKKDGKNAINWCKKALLLAQEENSISSQASSCKCLYESYKMLNDGNKALEYHERFLVLSDSLNRDVAGKKLQQIEFQRQVFADSLATVEKERLVQLAHEEEVRKKNRTRNILLGSGFLLLLLTGGFYSRWKYVRRSRDIISKEKDRSENLLLNILPAEIAEELKEKGRVDARDFEMVSILFTDFKEFTQTSEKLSAQELVSEINTCFEAFDAICSKHSVEKIKTIGDAYMAAGGLPVPTDDSVKNTVLAALEMQDFISNRKAKLDAEGKPGFEMRLGVHTGPVVAGIVGVKKFQYDIWGDTVNTASRMESSSQLGKVNISEATYEILKDDSQFSFESRGKVEAKGKGEVHMYYVSRA
jgi:class 3 adenylate cyclase